MNAGLTRSEVAARKDEIRQFFADYYAAFKTVSLSGTDDLSPLGEFFAVPLTVVTSETHVSLSTPDEVFHVLRLNVERLRALALESSVPQRSDLQFLNDNCCLLEVEWVRMGSSGEEVSTFRPLYVIAHTKIGWRIVTLVVLGDPPDDALITPSHPDLPPASRLPTPRGPTQS